MSDRIPCRKCHAGILPVTAKQYNGLCAVCVKKSGWKPVARKILAVFDVIGFTLVMPFLLAWMVVRRQWIRFRFPYDKARMLAEIIKIYPEKFEARSYFSGVIEGHWKPRKKMQAFFSQNEYYTYGLQDGSMLRRGEITPELIPTQRSLSPCPLIYKERPNLKSG